MRVSKRGFARFATFALLAASVLTACSLLTSYSGLEGNGGADAGAVPDASLGDVAEASPPDPCTLEGVPPAPDAGAGGPADLGRLVSAARTIRFLDGDGGPPFGLNIDRTCGGSCASSAAKPPVDPPSGIDNSAFDLFQVLKDIGLNLHDTAINDAVKNGLSTIVLRLDKYNGAPDDDDVQVELLNGAGVNELGDGGTSKARFDGTDEWSIDSRSIVSGVALFRSKVAYVRNNVLVARLDRYQVNLRVSGGGSVILGLAPELFSVVVTGKISSAAGGGLTLENVIIAGATTPEQFLLQIQRLGICSDNTLFGTAIDYVCAVRDLAASTASPVTDKCTRISMALGLDMVPARVAPDSKVVADPVGCDGGNPSVGCGSL